MKIKVFNNSMRFITVEGVWWRIHFPTKQVQHRCFVKTIYQYEDFIGDLKWVPAQRQLLDAENNNKQWFIRCSNCVELAPDDVTAHARIMGLDLAIKESPSIEDQLEELKNLMPDKPNKKWADTPVVPQATWIYTTSDSINPNNDIKQYLDSSQFTIKTWK